MPTVYVSFIRVNVCVHIAWVSALLVSDLWAMQEPLDVGRADSTIPRF